MPSLNYLLQPFLMTPHFPPFWEIGTPSIKNHGDKKTMYNKEVGSDFVHYIIFKKIAKSLPITFFSIEFCRTCLTRSVKYMEEEIQVKYYHVVWGHG